MKDLANRNQILLTPQVYDEMRYRPDISMFLQKLHVITTKNDDEMVYTQIQLKKEDAE
jgi:hypothetical protein